jgi:hypothetical protein
MVSTGDIYVRWLHRARSADSAITAVSRRASGRNGRRKARC